MDTLPAAPGSDSSADAAACATRSACAVATASESSSASNSAWMRQTRRCCKGRTLERDTNRQSRVRRLPPADSSALHSMRQKLFEIAARREVCGEPVHRRCLFSECVSFSFQNVSLSLFRRSIIGGCIRYRNVFEV